MIVDVRWSKGCIKSLKILEIIWKTGNWVASIIAQQNHPSKTIHHCPAIIIIIGSAPSQQNLQHSSFSEHQCTVQLSITIMEIKKFFKFKTLLHFWFWSKNNETFFNWCKSTRTCSTYFICQISQILLDLFAKKNMSGWSGNSKIWCVQQWGYAEKKTRKPKIPQISNWHFYMG